MFKTRYMTRLRRNVLSFWDAKLRVCIVGQARMRIAPIDRVLATTHVSPGALAKACPAQL